MKNLCILLALLISAIACEEKIIDEPVGYSDFYIKNNTAFDLDVCFYDSSDLVQINASATTLIGERISGDFGIHASPSMAYEFIRIYLADTDSLVYEQNPINDSIWMHTTPGGFVFWEYAEFTLEINPQDLGI